MVWRCFSPAVVVAASIVAHATTKAAKVCSARHRKGREHAEIRRQAPLDETGEVVLNLRNPRAKRHSMDKVAYESAISRAVEDFEGYATLAVILNVSVADLRQWAEGASYPPAEVLRRIVDLTRPRRTIEPSSSGLNRLRVR